MTNLHKQEKTYISNVLESAGDKARYDAQVKKILADKNILAWILKYAVQEFRDFTIEEIMDSIEGTPEISTVPVYPGKEKPEAVTGMANTDIVPVCFRHRWRRDTAAWLAVDRFVRRINTTGEGTGFRSGIWHSGHEGNEGGNAADVQFE